MIFTMPRSATAAIPHPFAGIEPSAEPQSVKKLLQDKAYGHVVTSTRMAHRSSQWSGWTTKATKSYSTP
jgi:hypothetical protein